MANKPLKSIKFPGLSDTYTVPEVDDTLAVTGAAADAKKVGDEISDIKADLNELTSEAGIREIVLGDYVTNSYVDTDGTIKAYNGWNRTDYIGVSGYKYLIANISTTYAAFFDSSRAFVGQAIITKDTQFSIPDSTEYIMISQSSAVMDTLSLNGYFAGGEITKINVTLNGIITATAEDVGKALKAKTVEDGEVTEWEFGEAGGENIYVLNRHQLIDWTAAGVKENVTWYDNNNAKTTSGNKFISDFIEFNAGDVICINYIDTIKYFDASKNFISTGGRTTLKYVLETAPAGTAYIKVQVLNASKDKAFVYRYMGEYYEYSAYSDNVTSSYIVDENVKKAILQSVNTDIKTDKIDYANIGDGSFSLSMLKDIDVFRWNVVDDERLLIGWRINETTGDSQFTGDSGSIVNITTDFCKVEPGVQYKGTNGYVYGYDANKTYVQKISRTTNYVTEIPNGIEYVRITDARQKSDSYSIPFVRDGYGKTFPYNASYPYKNIIPIFQNDDEKNGFKLYLDMEPWRNKRILVIGDSFSAPGTWQSEMCNNFYAICDSHAISGAGWCAGRTKTVYQLAQEVTVRPDIILIALGTNDVNDSSINIGEFVEGTSISDYSDETWYGGLQQALTYIRNTWTGVPCYVGFTPGAGLTGSRSARTNAFIDAMKEVCLAYSCVYIETRTCGMGYPYVQNDIIFRTSISDGHPSGEGQYQIARYMTDIMSAYKANRAWYTPN